MQTHWWFELCVILFQVILEVKLAYLWVLVSWHSWNLSIASLCAYIRSFLKFSSLKKRDFSNDVRTTFKVHLNSIYVFFAFYRPWIILNRRKLLSLYGSEIQHNIYPFESLHAVIRILSRRWIPAISLIILFLLQTRNPKNVVQKETMLELLPEILMVYFNCIVF